MISHEIVLSFEGVSVADANRYAEDARRHLLDADPSIAAERVREDPTTMDFGATLVLVLGAPAVVVAARALHGWLVRNNAVSLTLKTKNGTIIAKNLESKDVPEIAKALAAGKLKA